MSAYSLALLTAPTGWPLEMADIKAWLRMTADDEDALIGRLVAAATEATEKLLNRQLLAASWRLGLSRFPSGYLRLPKAPLRSVTSITYSDVNNTTQTLASTVYDVDALSDPGTISLAQSQSWPATYQKPNAVLVTYSAGYGLRQDIPAGILTAIQFAVARGYEHRGDGNEAGIVTTAVENALRIYWNGAWDHGEVC